MKSKQGNLLRKVRVCEAHQETIECPAGSKIDVQYAMYGRLKGNHVCGAWVLNDNCQAAKSLQIVQADCQGKRSCLLQANNAKFGDPCLLTMKYLEVSEFENFNIASIILHLAEDFRHLNLRQQI